MGTVICPLLLMVLYRAILYLSLAEKDLEGRARLYKLRKKTARE